MTDNPGPTHHDTRDLLHNFAEGIDPNSPGDTDTSANPTNNMHTEKPNPDEGWECPSCQQPNNPETTTCSGCGSNRYTPDIPDSYGDQPPAQPT